MATGGRQGTEGGAAFVFQVWDGGVRLDPLGNGLRQRATVMVQKRGGNPAGRSTSLSWREQLDPVYRWPAAGTVQHRSRGRRCEGAGVEGPSASSLLAAFIFLAK